MSLPKRHKLLTARRSPAWEKGLRPWQKRGGGRSPSLRCVVISAVDFVTDGFAGHPITDTTVVLQPCAKAGPQGTVDQATSLAKANRLGIANWGLTSGGNVAITFRTPECHTLFCLLNGAPHADA